VCSVLFAFRDAESQAEHLAQRGSGAAERRKTVRWAKLLHIGGNRAAATQSHMIPAPASGLALYSLPAKRRNSRLIALIRAR
jgi:hypothetical protein